MQQSDNAAKNDKKHKKNEIIDRFGNDDNSHSFDEKKRIQHDEISF